MGSKITADGDCSHEIKRCLLLGRKVMLVLGRVILLVIIGNLLCARKQRSKSEQVLKSPLMKVKEESEKAGLKLNIQETKIMASGPIT